MSFSGEPHQEWNCRDQSVQEKPQVNFRLAPSPYDRGFTLCSLLHALRFFVTSRPKADPPTSRPRGPVLNTREGAVAVSTGGAYALEQLKGRVTDAGQLGVIRGGWKNETTFIDMRLYSIPPRGEGI